MDVAIVCSDVEHPVVPWLRGWLQERESDHPGILVQQLKDAPAARVLFLVSCSEWVDEITRSRFDHVIVLHASDLPKGRGWSPHVWDLLNGAEAITVSAIDASDPVDSGAVWAKKTFEVPPHALWNEIHRRLFEAELDLMEQVLHQIQRGASPTPQPRDAEPTYHPRRRPADSEVDPELPLRELFNRIRVMDPDRYPAFFRMHGHTYTITLQKRDENDV
ncbi:formyltransferase family protein [Marinimicrobium locisalis]|uniref:formyltransferase family protein n=1 Tax=Marinimicrobium locisalis TaxID=546022 RepID=UPI003D2FF58C